MFLKGKKNVFFLNFVKLNTPPDQRIFNIFFEISSTILYGQSSDFVKITDNLIINKYFI